MKRLLAIALFVLHGDLSAQSCPTPTLSLTSTGGSPMYVVRLGVGNIPDDTLSSHTTANVASATALEHLLRNPIGQFRVRQTLEWRAEGCVPPPTQLDTVYFVRVDTVYIPTDTVILPPVVDPPIDPSEFRVFITAQPRFVGAADYSIDTGVFDSMDRAQVGVEVTLRVTGGLFGSGTTVVTRTTNTAGYVRINWEGMAPGDSLIVTSSGASPAFYIHTTSTPPPIDPNDPPALLADSLRIIPTSPITMDSTTNQIQLFAVVFEGSTPFVCANLGLGNGWYEVSISPTIVTERVGGRFVADATCVPQPLR